MATPLDLSIKRAVEEVDSGEGSEASKKAKLGSGDYSELRSIEEFYDLYGHLFRKPQAVWEQYLSDLKDHCRFREIQLFLRSKGRVQEAKEIQSLSDELAYSVQGSSEFRSRGWHLRPVPGPYNDYQRLLVADIYYYDDYGELMAEFGNIYCTYASDLAFLAFFKDLQNLITWDLSRKEAHRIGQDASKNFKDLDPEIVDFAIQEARSLKKCEQEEKELIPLYTKLWLEIVRKERDAREVLIDIKNEDAASFPASIKSIERVLSLWRFEKSEDAPFIRTLEGIKRNIDAASKGGYLDEKDIEELIFKHFHMYGPRKPLLNTYADFIERKLPVAVNLGLTTC